MTTPPPNRTRGSLSFSCAGEYRIKQAVEPTRGAAVTHQNTRPTGAVEPRARPLDAPSRDPDRSQHRALTTGEEAPRAENGAKM